MANWETFKLSELRLDQENYRTGPQAGQREAIRTLIAFENGDIAAGRELLLHILREVASTDFKFAYIEKDTDREDFAKKFAVLSVKSKTAAAPAGSAAAGTAPAAAPLTAPTAPSASSSPVAPSPRGSRVVSSSRPTLAPKTGARTFQVDGVRLNPLYRECREISVKGNENAAAFLLRVFIELSSEALLTEKNIPLPASATKTGKTSWADFGISLPTKIDNVLGFLDPTGKAKEFQPARVAKDPRSQATYSISTLHGYFHNLHMRPDGLALQSAWDSWETYLRRLHEAR